MTTSAGNVRVSFGSI